MLSEWSWSQRSLWLPITEEQTEQQYIDRTKRRAHFRAENKELKRQDQYVQKLRDAQIEPVYITNQLAEADGTAATIAAAATTSHTAAAESSTATVDTVPRQCAALTRSFTSRQCRVPIDWSALPSSLVPATHMPAARAARKQHQLQNMIDALRALLQHLELRRTTANSPVRPVVVDFCCGSGHLGFPVAFLFPECDVILLEHNASAVARAKQRLSSLRADTGGAWSNLRVVHAGLQHFDEPFDIGIGVHACGWLSDIIQAKCFQQQAAFLLAPCCIGKLRLGEGLQISLPLENGSTPSHVTAASARCTCGKQATASSPPPVRSCPLLHYPRSALYSSVLTLDQYLLLASKADYSDSSWDFSSAAATKGHAYKAFCEWDRCCAAREAGYVTALTKMNPPDCTPKNDVIFGIHKARWKEQA